VIPKKRRRQMSAPWAGEQIRMPWRADADYGPAACGSVSRERRAWIDVLHSVTYSVIEQHCDLARRGRHRLGLANTGREPPVECAQRGAGPSNGYGSKAQERSGPAPATACS
jgi:hypothetical protein